MKKKNFKKNEMKKLVMMGLTSGLLVSTGQVHAESSDCGDNCSEKTEVSRANCSSCSGPGKMEIAGDDSADCGDDCSEKSEVSRAGCSTCRQLSEMEVARGGCGGGGNSGNFGSCAGSTGRDRRYPIADAATTDQTNPSQRYQDPYNQNPSSSTPRYNPSSMNQNQPQSTQGQDPYNQYPSSSGPRYNQDSSNPSQSYNQSQQRSSQGYPYLSDQSTFTSTPKKAMTEKELMSQLNDEGKSMYQSLDADGKKMALQLANQYSDKNMAVKEAAKQAKSRNMNMKKSNY